MFVTQLCEDSFKDGFLSLNTLADLSLPYQLGSRDPLRKLTTHMTCDSQTSSVTIPICFAEAILDRQTA